MIIFKIFGTILNAISWVSPKRSGKIAFDLFSKPRRYKIKSEHTLQLLAEATPLCFLYEGFELIGYHWGENNTGPKVLLLHGWESHSGRWRVLIRQMLEHGMQVYAFDGPASGRSPGKRLTLNLYVDAALIFEREHGPFDAFVGHSMGGGVAIQLCRQLPREQHPPKMCILASYDEVESVFDWYQKTAQFTDKVRANFDRAVEVFVPGETVREYSNTAALKDFGHIEGLVIHSKDDARVSYHEAENLVAAWANSKLILVDGIGHSLYSDEVNKYVIDFVEN